MGAVVRRIHAAWLVTAIVVGAVSVGCTRDVTVQPVPSPDLSTVYLDGMGYAVSNKKNTVIVGGNKVPNLPDDLMILTLVVTSGETRPFDLSIDNVAISFGSDKRRPLSEDEFHSRVKSAQTLEALGYGLQAAGAGMQGNYLARELAVAQAGGLKGRRDAVAARLLKRQTIMPAETFGSIMAIKLPEAIAAPTTFHVSVDMNGEVHTIALRAAPKQ